MRNFATDTESLAQSIDAMAEDTGASCLRRLALDVPVQNLPAAKKKDFQASCNALKSAAESFVELNKVTSTYAKVLAQLADDKTASFTAELDDVRSAVEKIKDGDGKQYFEGAKLDAASSLAGFLLKAAADGYRQQHIKRLLDLHDDFVQHAGILRTFVRRGYLPTLASEAGNLETSVDVVERFHMKSEPLRARELLEQIEQHKVKLGERRKAADQAIIAIGKMEEAHASLRENMDKLDSKFLVRTLDEYAKQAKDVRRKLRAAF